MEQFQVFDNLAKYSKELASSIKAITAQIELPPKQRKSINRSDVDEIEKRFEECRSGMGTVKTKSVNRMRLQDMLDAFGPMFSQLETNTVNMQKHLQGFGYEPPEFVFSDDDMEDQEEDQDPFAAMSPIKSESSSRSIFLSDFKPQAQLQTQPQAQACPPPQQEALSKSFMEAEFQHTDDEEFNLLSFSEDISNGANTLKPNGLEPCDLQTNAFEPETVIKRPSYIREISESEYSQLPGYLINSIACDLLNQHIQSLNDYIYETCGEDEILLTKDEIISKAQRHEVPLLLLKANRITMVNCDGQTVYKPCGNAEY